MFKAKHVMTTDIVTVNVDDTIDEAVALSLQETGLHRAFKSTVRRFVLLENDDWNICCGEDCDPCVNELSRAVERAREILAAS